MPKIKTYSPKLSEIQSDWRVFDAEGKTLGRFASEIATILRGKDKPTFTRHMIVGDFVVVVNAEKIRVTGQKAEQKIYYRHTQYPGGLRAVSYKAMMSRFPERIIENAVKGMLPHNSLGRQLMRRLHVYVGPTHPHEAQVRAGQGKSFKSEETASKKDAKIKRPRTRRQRQADVESIESDAKPKVIEEAKLQAVAEETDLTALTIPKLKELANSKGLTIPSKARKADIIDIINKS